MQTVRKACSLHGRRGFALIEWLLVLAIATGIVAMAAGPWRRWWLGLALSRTEYAILASLAIARNEAVRLNRRVVLCRATAQGHCASKDFRNEGEQALADTEWPYGWLVVVDHPTQRKEGRAMDGDQDAPRVLHRVDAMPGIRLTVIQSKGPITFRPPMGLLVGRWGSFLIQPQTVPTGWSSSAEHPGSALSSRCVRLSGNGRARVVRGACE